MICPYCGQENPDDLEVCGFCGGTLRSEAQQPAVESQPGPAVEGKQPATEPEEEKMAPPATPPVTSRGIYGTKVWIFGGCAAFICLVLACIAAVLAFYRYGGGSGLINRTMNTPEATVSEQVSSTPVPVLITTSSIPVMTQGMSPQQGHELLFSDDFSDPNSGWDRTLEAEYSADYFEGAYRMTVFSEMTDSWANPGENKFGDVLIEVDATKKDGPDDNDFGVICRYQDATHFYYALISSDGYYGISKVTTDSTDLLGRETLGYSDLIKQGLATNRIRFECVGNSLTLFVNGQLIDQQSDIEYSSGNIGLIAGSFNTAGTDILFDNISVHAP